MKRRDFLATIGAASVCFAAPRAVLAAARPSYGNLLVLVEMKGGNDGLNTVVPYAADEYYALRPRTALSRDQLVQLDERTALHPALLPMLPAWQRGELAVVQGIGYPDGNLSHFRSIEIWDTASAANEYLSEGWLARVFAKAPVPAAYAADGVVVGSLELGPLAGRRARAIALSDPDQFTRQARLASAGGTGRTAALQHILKVESDIVQAAGGLAGDHAFATVFPQTPFGNAVRTAARVTAASSGIAAVKLSLNGFDTHSGQLATHARLLRDLADGLVALRSALVEVGRWESTLVMTYAEFGRRPRENQSAGTDHGTAAPHFVLGGRVRGGLYGEPPALTRLDGNGNLAYAVDFRELYATVIERWWGTSASAVLDGRYKPLDLVRS